MIWDELETYIARKELSQKAIKEVVEILENRQYTSEEEVESLVKVLLKLKPDVAYNFLIGNSVVASNELINKIVEKLCVKNPAKSGHIYVVIIAIAKAGYSEIANSLLLNFVQINISGKLNKQLYDGFRRAVKYGTDSFLFSKMEGWDTRALNLYGRLLTESMEYLNDTDFTIGVKKYFDINCLNIKLSESKENNIKKSNSEASKSKDTEKSINDTQNLELNELLKLLESKVTSINEERQSRVEEIEKLKAENISLKTLNTDLVAKNEILSTRNDEITQKHSECEYKIKTLSKELETVRVSLEKCKSKLDNVESAFGQAGQTELDALKNDIRRRLGSEYEKFIDIKDKAPDLDYYEILLAMVEDIYRALKKNGITF